MPNSGFVQRYLEFYKLPEGNATKRRITSNLEKVGRAFDELPSNLFDEKEVEALSSRFIELIKANHFSPARAQLLLDDIVLRGYRDLLNEEGELHKDLADKIKVFVIEKKYDALSAYRVALVAKFSDSLIKLDKEQPGQGDKLWGPDSFYRQIVEILNGFSDEYLQDRRALFMQTNRLMQINTLLASAPSSHSHDPVKIHTESFKKLILHEMKEDDQAKKNTKISIWVELMYQAKELSDFKTVFIIYHALREADVRRDNILLNDVIKIKYEECDQFVKQYKEEKKQAEQQKAEQKRPLDLKDEKKEVEKLMRNFITEYSLAVNRKLSVVDQGMQQKNTDMMATLVKQYGPELDKLEKAKNQFPSKHKFGSFFATTKYHAVACKAVKALLKSLEKESSVSDRLRLADDAVEALNKLSPKLSSALSEGDKMATQAVLDKLIGFAKLISDESKRLLPSSFDDDCVFVVRAPAAAAAAPAPERKRPS